MPLYEYRDKETGELVEKNVSMLERDEVEGFERVVSFKGLVWAPTSGGLK